MTTENSSNPVESVTPTDWCGRPLPQSEPIRKKREVRLTDRDWEILSGVADGMGMSFDDLLHHLAICEPSLVAPMVTGNLICVLRLVNQLPAMSPMGLKALVRAALNNLPTPT